LGAAIAPLKTRLAGDERTSLDVIAAYHDELHHAFSIALSGCQSACGTTAEGREAARGARAVLLNGVLFPYNRLLGQQKNEDALYAFGPAARGTFSRWMVQHTGFSGTQLDAALFVFQRLLDITDQVRRYNLKAWHDSRLIWLPLHLALRTEDHVNKEDLDTLVSNAVGRRIVHGNRMWYLYNYRFHEQLLRSIAETREYHVL
jgi:hypothetical protein